LFQSPRPSDLTFSTALLKAELSFRTAFRPVRRAFSMGSGNGELSVLLDTNHGSSHRFRPGFLSTGFLRECLALFARFSFLRLAENTQENFLFLYCPAKLAPSPCGQPFFLPAMNSVKTNPPVSFGRIPLLEESKVLFLCDGGKNRFFSFENAWFLATAAQSRSFFEN